MSPRSIISQVGVCLALLAASGCATSRHELQIDPPPEGLQYTESVYFDKGMSIPAAANLDLPDDPKDVVLFALSLSRMGRHQHAATFLEESAGRFESQGNRFAVACHAAAANEFLAAGDMDRFRTAVRNLRQTASRYQYAAFDKNTLALLALGDIATGSTRPNELTPKALKPLYATPTSNSRGR